MKITPTSTLTLFANVDLDPQYNFTIDFENLEKQEEYFDSKATQVLSYDDDYSYIRDKEELRVQAHIDDLFGINYLSFYNKNKRYYAFITSKRYVSETCTALTIKIDVIQSFMFDYEVDESFIEREHQDRFSGDTPIFNTVPENLEIGKSYNCVKRQEDNKAVMYLIVAKEPLGEISGTVPAGGEYSFSTDGTITRQKHGASGRLITNVHCYLLPFWNGYYHGVNSRTGGTATSTAYFSDDVLPSIAKYPNVIAIIPVKRLFAGITLKENISESTFEYDNYRPCRIFWKNDEIHPSNPGGAIVRALAKIVALDTVAEYEFEPLQPEKPTSKDVAPNIKCETKLFTHPYDFIRTSLYGVTKDFNREDFADKNIKFNWYLSLGAQGQNYLAPQNYKGESVNEYEKMTITGQNLTLRTDKWLEYELNNKASLNGGLVVSALQTAGTIGLAVATGGVGGAFAGSQALGFAGQVANEMIKRQDIKQMPDDIRLSSMDTTGTFALNYLQLIFEEHSIKPEFADKIFKYFFHYGYKVNNFEKPNLKSRFYFNYIKTIGVNIKSNLDADIKQEIASIYDNGITLWHYRDKATFKGVNNFEFENVEIALMN